MRSTEALFPAASWRKSSFCGSQGSCVEVAHVAETVGVRDTKDRDGGALLVSATAWDAFTARL